MHVVIVTSKKEYTYMHIHVHEVHVCLNKFYILEP